MKSRFAAGFIICVLAFTGTASADIIFGTGISGATNNVGSYAGIDDTSANGQFLGGVDDVLLVVTDVPLTIPAAGAARIQAADVLFTEVVYTPIGLDWSVFELNPQNDSDDGTFVLKVIDDGGTEWISGDFNLGNGENRVWAKAINGQSIVKVTVLASGALIEDIRQVRISQAVAIPEPGSMAILGIASVLGLGWGERKRFRGTKISVS